MVVASCVWKQTVNFIFLVLQGVVSETLIYCMKGDKCLKTPMYAACVWRVALLQKKTNCFFFSVICNALEEEILQRETLLSCAVISCEGNIECDVIIC
jgi:hypothetical protein